MPRGGHKVKAIRASPAETVATLPIPANPALMSKSSRTSVDWKAGIAAQTSLARSPSAATRLAVPSVNVSREPSPERLSISEAPSPTTRSRANSDCQRSEAVQLTTVESCISRTPSIRTSVEDETCDAALDTLDDLGLNSMQSGASSSLYSRDSASIYSSASSIYSSGASIYSFEDGDDFDPYARKGSSESDTTQCRQQMYAPLRRPAPQDAASCERSSLARKAALYKNSRLRPDLPLFSTNLPTWALVCRAVQASQDCYDSRAATRRGTYTPSDSSKDIKAMIVDDQKIDDTRTIIVSIRGSQFQSFSDWAVNKAANPVKPIGFIDDEENGCHAGFLQVTRSMITQVATQLQQLPDLSSRPSLLFTGHSAGGAVAAMLYSHMLSKSVCSHLTTLTGKFSSVSCITFGAPPVSVTPLVKHEHMPGVFLSFANEGDPVLRLTNAAYMKSLAKLMTSSPPALTTAAAPPPPPVKVVRGSRGATVYRQAPVTAPTIPWEDLPVWPTPAASLTNAGEVILLRDTDSGDSIASKVTAEDLDGVIFGDFVQHTCAMYIKRVKDVSLAAMMGRSS